MSEPRRFARIAKMKRYLDEHADEIETLGAGRLQFDFADGAPVKAQVTRFDRLEGAPGPERRPLTA